jgi:predicted Holliday junction resolvase-like endonuclease
VTGVLAAAPALPLHTAGPYVAAAYIVFVALILIYVAIMARKLARTQRELRELRRELEVKEELEPTVKESPRRSERAQERIA